MTSLTGLNSVETCLDAFTTKKGKGKGYKQLALSAIYFFLQT